jgi:hypothetical protein
MLSFKGTHERKNNLFPNCHFQEDLYPDTLADVPAVTADEWWCGANADPVMIPMNEQGVQIKKVCAGEKCQIKMVY